MPMNRFLTVLADNEDARRAHHRLRYRVFCEETGFEDPARFPDGLERDHYDAAAVHFLVWDRRLERWAGAMRLVDARRTRTPSEDICPYPLEALAPSRHTSVELSRLCILREYRRGILPDQATPSRDPQHGDQVLMRLLYASFGWGLDNGVSHCHGIVTAPLARILVRLGIPLERLGEEVSHRGTRIPHRYEIRRAMAGVAARRPDFADMISRSRAYVPHSVFAMADQDRERTRSPVAGIALLPTRA